jgi:hypothetical protein
MYLLAFYLGYLSILDQLVIGELIPLRLLFCFMFVGYIELTDWIIDISSCSRSLNLLGSSAQIKILFSLASYYLPHTDRYAIDCK